MSKIISASAPVRIDFGGSTLDLLPLIEIFPENIVTNLAVSLNAEVEISLGQGTFTVSSLRDQKDYSFNSLTGMKEDKSTRLFAYAIEHLAPDISGINIRYNTGSPYGAGLGGSSSLLVAFNAALLSMLGEKYIKESIVHLSGDIEQKLIEGPIGKQDYIAASFGGLSVIKFTGENKFIREELSLHGLPFADILAVYFTREPHFSGNTNFEIARSCMNGDTVILQKMKRIEENSKAIYNSLRNNDIPGLIKNLHKEMHLRRDLLPSITTPIIDQMEEEAIALGGALKVCGAGGGGSVFVILPNGNFHEFDKKVKEIGAIKLDAEIHTNGVTVLER
ncbi:MAG: hypothetical protein JW737_04295 [Acidobacteria bacterium]|nr:hypothetical protein [Acidobacteriota bacterium]